MAPNSQEVLTDVDGHPLSEYEVQRLERMRKNNAYMESIGLGAAKKKMLEMTRATNKNKKRSTTAYEGPEVKRGEERRSKRLKRKQEDDNLVMLSYAEPDDRTLRAVRQDQDYDESDEDDSNVEDRRLSAPRRGRRVILSGQDFSLTDQEREVLSKNSIDDNYLSKFQEFLVFHNKISQPNARNVMRQVTKLAIGEGVRYESPQYGWPPGCYFLKGTKVTPLSDIVDLMQQAQEAEDKWGRDRGNGWLLSHPLKKMLLFQQFCLQNPDFLTATCRLQEYYDEDSR